MRLSYRASFLTVVIGLLTSTAASAAATTVHTLREQTLERRQTAALELVRQHPAVQFYEVGSRINTVYGTPLEFGASPEDAAEKFRLKYAGLFGVPAAQLAAKSFLADERHTQPVMFDRNSGAYKFTLVYYAQEQDGVPVFRSELRLLVRNEPGFPIVLARSSLRNIGDFGMARAAVGPPALSTLAASTAHPKLAAFSPLRQVIWAGVEEDEVVPTLAYEFTGETVGALDSREKYLFVTDAATGAILYEENQILNVDVTGNVSGMSTPGQAADTCAAEIVRPMPYARVNIGATQAFADVDGNFTIPNPGATPVNVDSPVRGQRFVVFDQAAATPTETLNVTPPGPANFTHNAANTNEFIRASVNAYINANIVRDYVLQYNPAYPAIAVQTNFTVNTNINSNCNAFYDGVSINFYRAGGGCANTGFGDVVHHEYGHHVVQMAGSGQGAYGEGMSDCMGVLISDQPQLGVGFNTCANGIRTASNSLLYPCTAAIHTCGQVISGCVWETRNELVVTNPSDYRDILSSLTINSVLMHLGSSITPTICIDFLTLDDDDANLANGTPHFNQINTGFTDHNMGIKPLGAVAFDYPNGRPEFVTPNSPFVLRVDVLPGTGTPQPGTGMFFYRIGNAGAFTGVAMNEISANQYEATLPATTCPDSIQYYVSAQSTTAATATDPATAPALYFWTVPSSGIIPVASYDFEVNPGWTISNSGITDGAWDAAPGIPINCGRGDPTSDYDGSGRCFLTDNSAAASCNSDIDGGTTTLTSQVFDLTGLNAPHVRYARWYSNSEGAEPEADSFVVQVSSNGGGAWVTLETVGPTRFSTNGEVIGDWHVRTFRIDDYVPITNQFQIRFQASDLAGGSVVEAGLDAFSLFSFDCIVPCGAATGDMNGDNDVNGLDVNEFVKVLLLGGTPQQVCDGDFNSSTALDPGDVPGFVNALIGL